jgi:hypothetical protein
MVETGYLGEVYELERQSLESLTTLNSAEATERDASFSAFSVPSVALAVQPRWPGQVRLKEE